MRDHKVGWWTMGRLRVRRFFSALGFSASLLLSATVLSESASASPQWCEEDPVFLVNGALVDVSTVFPASYTSTVQGPVAFELLVPSNAVAAVVSLPGDIPMTAKITHSLPATGLLSVGVPVVVKVTVKATASFDTKTSVTGTYLWLSSSAWGKSNTTTQVKFTLIGL
jgi:hypothetical protein